MKLDHIGIAVKGLDSSADIFRDILGVDPGHTEKIAEQKVKVCSFDIGGCEIELLEGESPESPISRFLEGKKGGGIHHLAFEVDDLEQKIKELTRKGYYMIDGYPKRGKEGSRIAFIHPKATDGVLIELVQRKK